MQRKVRRKEQARLGTFLLAALCACSAFAATVPAQAKPAARMSEEIVLRNGFNLICNHEQVVGKSVRLYLDASDQNFLTVAAGQIVSRTPVPASLADADDPAAPTQPVATGLRPHETQSLQQMLNTAGRKHDIDSLLLASIVEQESGGRPRAVSRAGARGLMQLMPATAAQLGVTNSFAPAQNIAGGTAYLDTLLDRYHNNLALALAAYNAGPAAVARWHGIPPYAETRRYVARVIHQYNLRYEAQVRARRRARKPYREHNAVETLALIQSGAKD